MLTSAPVKRTSRNKGVVVSGSKTDRILDMLKAGPMAHNDICSALGMESKDVSPALNRCLKKGYIVRIKRGVYAPKEVSNG